MRMVVFVIVNVFILKIMVVAIAKTGLTQIISQIS